MGRPDHRPDVDRSSQRPELTFDRGPDHEARAQLGREERRLRRHQEALARQCARSRRRSPAGSARQPTASPARTASTTQVDAVLVRHAVRRHPASTCLEPQPVERPHPVERARTREPATAPSPFGSDQAEHAARVPSEARVSGRPRPASLRSNEPSSAATRSSHDDVVVEPVDRLDAQLVGDEFADEGERLLGGDRRNLRASARRSSRIRPADPVAVVTVGDQDVVGGRSARRSHRSAPGRSPVRRRAPRRRR